MSESTISKEEIKQLLLFMNRIKTFEKIFVIQKESVTRLIWGLLLFSAGLLDYVITFMVYQAESYGILTIIPWALAMLSGLIIQTFSERHLTNVYNWEQPKKEKNKDDLILILGFALMGVVVIIFNTPSMAIFIFPCIALISGFLAYYTDRKYVVKYKEILQKESSFIVTFFCFLAAILMVIIGLIDMNNINLHSVIFGAAIGGGFSFTAFWNKKSLDDYVKEEDLSSSS